MSVSARSQFTQPFSSLLFDVIHIPFPSKGKEQETISNLRVEILKNKSELAAFIFEPLVLGAGGMLMYDAVILAKLLIELLWNIILSILKLRR